VKIALIIIGALALYFVFTGLLFRRKLKAYNPANYHENIKILTDVNFDEKISTGVSLVDFWAEWCMPCKMQGPIIDEVAKEVGNIAQICKLDVQTYQNAASKYNVNNIPTIILFKDGVEIKRFIGIKPKNMLVKEIQNYC
jgi:thioredoxin 1